MKRPILFALSLLALVSISERALAAAGATVLPIVAEDNAWTSLGVGPLVVTVQSGNGVLINATAANCNGAAAAKSALIRSTESASMYTNFAVCVKAVSGSAVILIGPTAQP